MRDLRIPLVLLAIAMLSLGLYIRADDSKITPKVINERGDKIANRISSQADTLNELKDSNKWNEDQWKVLLYRNQLALNKLKSAFFEVELCVLAKDKDYCEHSSRDLDETEVELNKLDQEIIKVGEVSL